MTTQPHDEESENQLMSEYPTVVVVVRSDHQDVGDAPDYHKWIYRELIESVS